MSDVNVSVNTSVIKLEVVENGGRDIGPAGPIGPTGPTGSPSFFAGTFQSEAELNAAWPNGPTKNYTNYWTIVYIDGVPNTYTWKSYFYGWQSVGVLNFPQGPAGNPGAIGPTGPTGNTGKDGVTGSPGTAGVAGVTGPTGPTGDVYRSTSTTSTSLDGLTTGNIVSLTVPAGLAYSKVQSVLAAYSITQYFNANVQSYAGTGLTLYVTGVCGSGSNLQPWDVNLAGAVGQQGPKGDNGDPGTPGATGPTGAAGSGPTAYVSYINGQTGSLQAVTKWNGLTGDISINYAGSVIGLNGIKVDAVPAVEPPYGTVYAVSCTGITQIAAGTAISISPKGGTGTVTITNTGVRSLGVGSGLTLINGPYTPAISNTGVLSLNGSVGDLYAVGSLSGLTGTIGLSAGTNVTISPTGNTLTIAVPSVVTQYNGLTGNVQGVSKLNGSTGDVFAVSSLQGLTGALGISAGSGFTFTINGNTFIFSASGNVSGATGVLSYNGKTGDVQGVSKLIGGTGISISPAGGTGDMTVWTTGILSLRQGAGGISIDNTIPNSPIIANTGVWSLTTQDDNALTSGITFVNYVKQINGSTGTITNVAFTNIGQTFTQNQIINTSGQRKTVYKDNGFDFTNLFGTVTRSINYDLTGPTTATISFPNSSGTLALQNNTVTAVNGLTGTVGLSSGSSNLTITPTGNTLVFSVSSTSSSGVTDGSAIIWKLQPKGNCAGDLISFSGQTWSPTPRDYVATPSLWQTVPVDGPGGRYPSSQDQTPSSESINGASGAGFVLGELVQINLSYGASTSGITFNSGIWWLNYTRYYSSADPGENVIGTFASSYSGLTLINRPTFYQPQNDATFPNTDVVGFAIKIRGNTLTAYDGRGGPYGSTTCNPDPNQRPLGDVTDPCAGFGVTGWNVCTQPVTGFTYNGCYYNNGCSSPICP